MIGSLGQRLVIAATLCLVVLAASLWVTSASGHWSSPLNLSQSEVFTEDVSVAADSQGRVHVVWSEGGQIVHRHQLPVGWSARAAAAKSNARATLPTNALPTIAISLSLGKNKFLEPMITD